MGRWGKTFGLWLALAGMAGGQSMEALAFDWCRDVPVDPRATVGCLPNGLHYYILPHGEPPERVSLRLLVGAGSLMEREGERGLAHYLEHLAFCGSENFKRGDLIEYLQRMGMRFGHHTNAHTGFDETVYKLELPRNDRQTIKDGLLVFRDYMGGLLLEEKEIDRERGVILAELLNCDSPQYRDALERCRFSFPDSILGWRFPIGEKSVIESLQRAHFLEFHGKFYVPSNAAVLVVGDVDAPTVVQLLSLVMGDLPADEGVAEVELGSFELSDTRVQMHRESELPQAWVSISSAEPLENYEDNRATRYEWLLQRLAHHALSRRLEILSKKPDAPFFAGESDSQVTLRNGLRTAWIQMSADAARVRETLQVAEQELRRALEFGFTPEEVERARRVLLRRFENARLQEDTLRSDRLANAWVDCVSGQRVPTSAAWDETFARECLEDLRCEDVWNAFRRLWAAKNRSIYVSGDLPKNLSESALHATHSRSRRSMLRPPLREAAQRFAYDNFGETGRVTAGSVEEDIGLHQWRFANGLRLNLRPTDFEAGQVQVRLRIGQGLLSEPEESPGLSKFANWAFVEGGLGSYTFEELRDLLAGHVVGVKFTTGADAFFLSAHTTREDFELQMRLLAAYVSDAGFREEGEREAQKTLAQVYPELTHTVDGAMADGGDRFLHGGDGRFGYPQRTRMERHSMGDLRRWLQPQLENGYVELTVVGDVDPEEVLRVVGETLGALPERTGEPAPADVPMGLPRGGNAQLSYVTEIPKGYVQLSWATDDGWDVQQRRRLDLLSDVLEDRVRLRIRRDMGDTYSPRAGHLSSLVFKNYGYLYVAALVDVERVNDVAFIIREIADDLRERGMGEDEFTRVHRPALTEVREQLRRNAYWLNGLDGVQAQPEKKEFLRTLLPFYEGVRREDLGEVLKFLDEGRLSIIRIRPEAG